MSQRLNFSATAREAYGSVVNLESYVQANIESALLHLIKLRASILNDRRLATQDRGTGVTVGAGTTRRIDTSPFRAGSPR